MPKLMRKPTVLAVDDDRGNLLALEATLGKEFELVTAGSGFEAVDLLEAGADVDVILLDVQMPGMDGFETAARIKSMPACADIPIAFITAVYREDPHVKEGYRAGGVDYFGKPFDPEILKLKLANYAAFRQWSNLLAERERSIRESEELMGLGRRMALLLEHASVGVAVTDATGRVQQANEEYRAISAGTAPAEAAALVARAVAEAATCHDSVEGRRDSSPRSLVRVASPLRDATGRIAGAALLLCDLTERREVERELQRRIQRLADAGPALA
jgi:CheY-like chemotaxis protein